MPMRKRRAALASNGTAGVAGGHGMGGAAPLPSLTSRRHRQVKLEEDGEARKLARAANLCSGFGASDLGPHREGLRAGGSVLDGRKVIAVEVEEVVDLVVGREEPLRLAG